VATATPEQGPSLRQNWIVGPATDLLLIVVAPLLAFVWSIAFYVIGGPSLVWTVFMVFNIAHHFPTFIRIYGDRDCFRRFRWSLVLGPLIPFTVAMVVAVYLVTDPDPTKQLEDKFGRLIFLWMILTLWDPWHFLMQHYGFMRIYDRHNQAPRKLASWMDYLISATWFIFIMIGAVQWFCGEVLYSLYNNHQIPLLLWINAPTYRLILTLAFAAATAMTIVYVGYVIWCRSKGYFVSYVKLTMLLVTFGVMYLTYLPDSFIGRYFPNWTFATGFATLGMVHVTQYLAIVWKYNRSLASQGKRRSRAGWFTSAFAKGGLFIAAAYVLICLLYGAMLSEDVAPAFLVKQRPFGLSNTAVGWILATIWAVGFTSTFTHYYYDGFIWKVRHKENRENLAMQGNKPASDDRSNSDGEKTPVSSWWDRRNRNTAGATLGRQLVYFGIPFAMLIFTYIARGESRRAPLKQIRDAYSATARDEEMLASVEATIGEIDNQMRVVATVAELDVRRRAGHLTYLAELKFAASTARFELLQPQGQELSAGQLAEHRQQIGDAIRYLEQALAIPDVDDFRHREGGGARAEIKQRLKTWQKRFDELGAKT